GGGEGAPWAAGGRAGAPPPAARDEPLRALREEPLLEAGALRGDATDLLRVHASRFNHNSVEGSSARRVRRARPGSEKPDVHGQEDRGKSGIVGRDLEDLAVANPGRDAHGHRKPARDLAVAEAAVAAEERAPGG